MLKKFYVQVDHEKRITDVIEFPHSNYIEVEFAVPLPPNIMGGAYKLVNEQPIYREEWDKYLHNERLNEIELALVDVMLGGDL